jgi:hypothetical protein
MVITREGEVYRGKRQLISLMSAADIAYRRLIFVSEWLSTLHYNEFEATKAAATLGVHTDFPMHGRTPQRNGRLVHGQTSSKHCQWLHRDYFRFN